MKLSGTVERDPPILWDGRGIGVLKLVEYEKLIRIKELQKMGLPRDLKRGNRISAEVSEDNLYYHLTSMTRGEAPAPNISPPPSSSPQTGKEPESPKTTEIVLQDEKLTNLANKIIALRDRYEESIKKDVLSLHWEIGQEIHSTRATGEDSYTALSRSTGIGRDILWRSVAFYEKYPNRDYEIKAWRRHVAELPEIKDTEPPRDTPKSGGEVVCSICNEPHRLVHLSEGHHKLEAIKK